MDSSSSQQPFQANERNPREMNLRTVESDDEPGFTRIEHGGDETGPPFLNKPENDAELPHGNIEDPMLVDTSQTTPRQHHGESPIRREAWPPPTIDGGAQVRCGSMMSIVEDEEDSFVRRVQGICLQATREYIINFKRNIDQRRGSLAELPQTNDSSNSGSQSTVTNAPEGFESIEKLYRESRATSSLMTNANTICHVLYASAYTTRMLFPDSESDAALKMYSIMECSKKVLIGLEGRKGKEGDLKQAMKEIFNNGKQLCAGLRDDHSERAIEDLRKGYLGEDHDKA